MRIAVPDFVLSTMFPLIAAKELRIFTEEGQDIELVLNRSLKAEKSLSNGAVDCPAAHRRPGSCRSLSTSYFRRSSNGAARAVMAESFRTPSNGPFTL